MVRQMDLKVNRPFNLVGSGSQRRDMCVVTFLTYVGSGRRIEKREVHD